MSVLDGSELTVERLAEKSAEESVIDVEGCPGASNLARSLVLLSAF
jgi:hypothetical protein